MLVNVLNALPALAAGTYSCASDDGEQAVLTMPHRRVAMELSGCRQVDIAVDGAVQPVLEGALTDSLSQVIYKLLGNPPVASRSPAATAGQ